MWDRARFLILGWWSRLVSRRPGWVLAVTGALALVSIVIAAGQLRFESNRNALIDDDLSWNRRFIEWRQQFPSTSDLVVVVDTYDDAGRPDEQAAARARALVDELGPELRRQDAVLDAVWGFDPSQVHPRAVRLEAMPVFKRRMTQMAASGPLLQSETPSALLSRAAQQMRRADAQALGGLDPATGIDQFRSLIEAFNRRLRTPVSESVDLGRDVEGGGRSTDWHYLRSENGRMLLIRVTPRRDADAISPYQRAIEAVRDTLDQAREAHPEVAFGLTGIKVIEADETRAATTDSTRASLLAVGLIALVLIIAFHSFRVPLMLITALGIGIAWSFGFLTLAVGHLQVISVVFVVLLLGLGVAFGIHLASGFELVRHQYPDTQAGFRDALQQTLETIGPGLMTGAVTTAVAFATTLFTDFRGVAEMGVIASAGVILCLIAMCSVYPALLRLLKPLHRHFKPMAARRMHLFDERWVMPFVRRPAVTLILAGVVVAASIAGIAQMRFDYNLMALMPREMNSVQWQRRLVEQGGQSVWAATSVVDSLKAARQRTSAFRGRELVGSVGGIGRLFPPHAEQRQRFIEKTRDRVGSIAERVAQQQGTAPGTAATDPATQAGQETQPATRGADRELLEQVESLRLALPVASLRAPSSLQSNLGQLQQALNAFSQTVNTLSNAELDARLNALRADYGQWRRNVARQIDQALAPGPVRLDDLPPKLLEPFIGRADNGERRYALAVHPKLPTGVNDPLEPGFLGRFVQHVYSIDPQATGVIVQVYESGELIWRSYLWAGVYALLAVFLIVSFDFQSFADGALALVPVAAGFALTFAAMHLAGVKINPANIIVLPLMFGIGVDAGVHVLHRYRQAPFRDPPGLSAGTGKGITLTSLTTMIGFGALMIARHRGIASLGFVLTVGIGLTMLACWTVMPAWLALRNQLHRRRYNTS